MILASYLDYDYIKDSSSGLSLGGLNLFFVIALIVFTILLIAIITLSIILLVKYSGLKKRFNTINTATANMQTDVNVNTVGAVFCKKCGSQFSAALRECPFCGEKR